MGYTADQEGYAVLRRELGDFKASLPAGDQARYPFAFEPGNRNEGFMTASQVNYVARCGSFAGSGYAYTGALKVLKVIMNYEYLWMNLRVKGGAYGCMSSFGRSGEGYMVSYRDPKLLKTNEIFEKSVDYTEHFDVSERDMTKYIIGTISSMDTPLNARAKGMRSLSAWMTGVTEEQVQKERDQVLGCGVEEIRALAPYLKAMLSQNHICVIGNEEKLEGQKQLFEVTESLFH